MAVTPVSRRIRPLDPLLANQIAAGEVVERPASVIKELLENSLDAGAASIQLEVEQGGVALIRVRDDGSGILRDDLALALARHATSKIYDQRELMQVLSLGFRGEALASIASVSRLELISRHGSEEHGWRAAADSEPVPHAHPVGTTVEVRELFYNTPARRKFLRSERTELEHVSEVVRRIALSRHDVALSLSHNQRQLLAVRPAEGRGEQERRVAAVCGRAFLEAARFLEFEVAGLRLWGWLLPPEQARAQADLQYFYINGRIIRDRVVSHALRLAYGDALPAGRHPAYVLYLEMEPAQVDVNVHPTKHEVRFRDVRHVHDFLYRALREAVASANGGGMVATPDAHAVQEPAVVYRPAPVPSTEGEVQLPAELRIVGMVLGQYLLAEQGAVVRLIDLRAARAHQVELAMDEALQNGGALRTQPLLLPQQCEVSTAQQELLERYSPLIRRLGFELDALAPGRWVLRQVPALLRQVAPQPLLMALLEGLMAAATDDLKPVVAALADCAGRHGSLPERQEWPGLVAAFGGQVDIDGVAVSLDEAELSRLLQRGG